MKLTVTFEDNDAVLGVEVPADMAVSDLRGYVLEEANLPVDSTRVSLFFHGKILRDNTTLGQSGLGDGDMILARTETAQVGHSNAGDFETRNNSTGNSANQNNNHNSSRYHPVPSSNHHRSMPKNSQSAANPPHPSSDANRGDPQQLFQGSAAGDQVEAARQAILYNPALFAELQLQAPALAGAIHNRDAFSRVYREIQEQNNANSDLTFEERRAIDENYQMAMEEMPEAFASVTMLYANIEVNGVPVKAFIDSGAQTTIMSPSSAEKCNLSHLIDKRHRGLAYGVGQAQILGRIHMAPIKIGSSYFACAMTVIEGTNMEMILGLDMLRHHQATIDLRRNILIMGEEELPFLDESEIPRQSLPDVPQDEQERVTISAPITGPGQAPFQPGVTRKTLDSSRTNNAGDSNSNHNESNEPRSKDNSSDSASKRSQNEASNPNGESAQSESQRAPPQSKYNKHGSNDNPTTSSHHSISNSTSTTTSAGDSKHPLPKSSSKDQYSPDTIKNLMGLGFSRDQVIQALQISNGNPDVAAAHLFES